MVAVFSNDLGIKVDVIPCFRTRNIISSGTYKAWKALTLFCNEFYRSFKWLVICVKKAGI